MNDKYNLADNKYSFKKRILGVSFFGLCITQAKEGCGCNLGFRKDYRPK